MEKFTQFINDHFAPKFAKFGANPYVQGLRDGMISTTPFTIVGSLFIII